MANIHIKTAWDNIRRSPFQAMAATFVLSITFFVTSVLAILGYASNQALNYFQTRPQIIAFLNEEAEAGAISELQTELSKDTRVKDVVYISKEDALEIYKQATSDNPLLSELVSPSVFPASLEFSVTDLSYAEEIIDNVKAEEIVDEVGFTASVGGEETLSNVVDNLRRITWYVRVGGGAFVATLLTTSFLVLLVIISMRLSSRKDEIGVLKLIGATPGFIRKPIILESVIYATSGVFLGWFMAFVLVLYVTPKRHKLFW